MCREGEVFALAWNRGCPVAPNQLPLITEGGYSYSPYITFEPELRTLNRLRTIRRVKMGKTEAETISPPANTMRERVGYSRAKMWFLVTGNRWTGSGLLLFVTFAIIVFAGVFVSGSLSSVLSSSTVSGLFQTLFLGVVTTVALTLAIG